jgi:hypothetical protein
MKPLLASLTLAIVLTPTLVSAVEQKGMTLFFSFEELREFLQHPSSGQIVLPLSLQFKEEEKHGSFPPYGTQWQSSLTINSTTRPDTQRPSLWGF